MRTLLIAITLAVSAASSHGLTITTNANDQPLAVDGLVVGGELFDVSIRYNESFNDVYGTDVIPSTLPFVTASGTTGAEAAAEALKTALLAETIAPVITTTIVIPALDSFLTSTDFATPGLIYNSASFPWRTTMIGDLRTTQGDFGGFTIWTPTIIPEPLTTAMMLLALSPLLMRRRRTA